MKDLFFVKVTDFILKRKVSYYINCNEIESFSVVHTKEGKIVYCVVLLNDNRNYICLHHIKKSDYERLKRL